MERMEPKQSTHELKRVQAARFLRRDQLLIFWLRGTTELLLYAPAWLVPAVYGLETVLSRLLWLLHLPLLTLLGSILAYPIRRVWLRSLTALAAGAAETLLLAPADWRQSALIAAGGAVAVLRGMAVTSAESRFSDVPRYGIGIATYALSGMICNHLPEWAPYMPWLTAAGVVSLAIVLLTWNKRLLQRETLSSEPRTVPAAARRHNRLMVVAVLLLSTGITAAASGAAGQMLLRLLRAFFGLLASARNALPEPPLEQAAPPPLLQPQGEPGWLARVLDVLFLVLGISVCMAVLLLLARSVYRHRRDIAKWVSRLFARLASLLGRTSKPAADSGYIDEETTIWSWEMAEKALKRHLRRRFTGSGTNPRWSDLRNNRERARYLYRQWLGRLRDAGYAAPRHLTPDEIRRAAAKWEKEAAAGGRRLPDAGMLYSDKLVGLYYKARYGEDDIENEEIERLAGRNIK